MSASPAGEATQLVLCNSRAAAEAVRHLQRKLRMANARNAELTAENARLAELADEQQAIALEAEQALREEGAAVAARLAEVRVGFEASTAEAEKLRAALSEAQAKLAASEAREAEWRRRWEDARADGERWHGRAEAAAAAQTPTSPPPQPTQYVAPTPTPAPRSEPTAVNLTVDARNSAEPWQATPQQPSRHHGMPAVYAMPPVAAHGTPAVYAAPPPSASVAHGTPAADAAPPPSASVAHGTPAAYAAPPPSASAGHAAAAYTAAPASRGTAREPAHDTFSPASASVVSPLSSQHTAQSGGWSTPYAPSATQAPHAQAAVMVPPVAHATPTSAQSPPAPAATPGAGSAVGGVAHETVVRVLSLGAALLEEKYRDLLTDVPKSRRRAIVEQVDSASRGWPASERESRQRSAVQAAVDAARRGIGGHVDAVWDAASLSDSSTLRIGGGYLYSPGGGLLSTADFPGSPDDAIPRIAAGPHASPHVGMPPATAADGNHLLLSIPPASPSDPHEGTAYALLKAEEELHALQDAYRSLLASATRVAGAERSASRGKKRGKSRALPNLEAELAACTRRMHGAAARVGVLRAAVSGAGTSPSSAPPDAVAAAPSSL